MNGKSYALAAVIVVLVTAWMATGYVARGDAEPAPQSETDASGVEPMTVQVRQETARPVARQLTSQGEARPNRRVEIRAETTGRVAGIYVEKGAEVSNGEPLLRIAENDREARLEQAKAAVEQRKADYEAAQKLGDKGYQSSARIREAFAALQSARAERAAIREDIANTRIRAPFGGVVDDRMVEIGDYLSPGDPVALLVENNPLKVAVNIAQDDITSVRVGASAEVDLATGQSLSGEVSFVAAAADSRTRTFRVEVTVPNPNQLPAGISATVRLPLGEVRAHFLSPAVLALDENGVLGAKTVGADGTVAFHPVEIVRSERRGVWVTGLPDSVRLITIGQGFVSAGETVRTVAAEESDPGAVGPGPPATSLSDADAP